MTEHTHIDEPLAEALANVRDTAPQPSTESARAAFLAEAGALRRQPRRLIRFPARRMLAAASMAAVLTVAGLALSPDLRALAQSIIDFIVPGESDRRETTVFVGGPAPATNADPYPLTMEEAAAQDSYLMAPTVLPGNFTFDGASYIAEIDRVELSYTCGAPWRINVYQRAISEDELAQMRPYQAGASATVQDVQIGDVTGQYVRGWWVPEVDQAALDAARESDTQVPVQAQNVWSNDIEFHQLVWYADGMLYTIMTAGGLLSEGAELSTQSACLLSVDELAAMARSLAPVQ